MTTTNEYGTTLHTDPATGKTTVIVDAATAARRKAAGFAFRDRLENALTAYGRGDEVMAVRKKQGR